MTDYILELPTSDFPNYSYTTDLDEVEYKLNFRFDVYKSSWYLSIFNKEGVALLSGVRLVCWLDLLAQYTKEELPIGRMGLVPKSVEFPKSPEITLENLSTDFELIYSSVN